jgi:tetratricopeptide (TPR) repeat protein
MVRVQQAFEFVRELEPTYTDGVRRMLARARIDEGWSLLGSGGALCLDDVMGQFLEALDRDGDLRSEPNSLGRTLMDGLATLGARFEEEGEFALGAELMERVVAIHADDARWWNNLGYFCREKATRIETGEIAVESDRETAARTVYEKSWRAYQRAVELAPNDARIVNDAALIQVYHLRTDLSIAQEMLLHAIEVGEQRLAELGPSAPDEQRFPIAQAVGDAYQNLGYTHYHLLGDPRKAREYFLLSIATESGDRSEMQAYVDAIDGKRDPIPERRAGAFAAPREEWREERGSLTWERSLTDALARTSAENRIVLVFHRGAGLGLVAPFLDGFVKQRATTERFASAIPVAADLARHAPVDYRTDGYRIACPVYGTITCGEHVRAAREFAAWWKQRHEGRSPGVGEEAIFFLMPDGEPAALPDEGRRALFAGDDDRADDLGELQRRIGEPRPPVDLLALRKQLRMGDSLESLHAAEKLAAAPGIEAQLLIEETLFDAGLDEMLRETRWSICRPAPHRRGRPPGTEALLATLLLQARDTRLAEHVAALWLQGFDVAPFEARSHGARRRMFGDVVAPTMAGTLPIHDAGTSGRASRARRRGWSWHCGNRPGVLGMSIPDALPVCSRERCRTRRSVLGRPCSAPACWQREARSSGRPAQRPASARSDLRRARAENRALIG